MKEEELRKWLLSLNPAEDSENIVAYGTPNLPYDFRQKKRVFFLSDLEDFYLRNDDEWKKCWDANFYDFDERKYLISLE